MRMHITFVLSSLKLSGGVILVIEIANRLAIRGHQVTLLAPLNAIDPEIHQRIRPPVQVRFASVGIPATRNPLKLLNLILSLVQNTPPGDVVIATHTPTTLPVLLATWWKRQKPLWLYMDYPEMFRRRPMERFLLNTAPYGFSTIIAISSFLAQNAAKRTFGKVHLIKPGLGIEILEEELHLSNLRSDQERQGWRIMYVGDDRPRKGLKDFIVAMEKVYAHSLPICAVIVCKHECQLKIDIPHELYIRPSDHELAKLYLNCDIFVSTSWEEGLGYPPLQAMALGKPCVIAESGGSQDYTTHGFNAIVVPSQDPQAVAEGIIQLINDEQLRSMLGRNGQLTASQYNWEKAIDEFEKLLFSTV